MSSPPYPAVAVANFFIDTAVEDPDVGPVTQLKLQKLVYIAHGWHLAIYDEHLIKEPVEAWEFGPVVRDLYSRAGDYGSDPISDRLDGTSSRSTPELLEIPSSDERTRNFLRSVWQTYREYSAVELTSITHKEDTPWYDTWERRGGKENKTDPIPSDTIKDHYKSLWDEHS
jgi:uncharacterized phage-associated protein